MYNSLDVTERAYRICRYDGRWEGSYPNDTSRPKGYTHFEMCLNPVLRNLYYLLKRDGRQDVVQVNLIYTYIWNTIHLLLHNNLRNETSTSYIRVVCTPYYDKVPEYCQNQ